MEHRRASARPKRAPRRRADPPIARPLRARRLPAFRPGQMVSRRKPAALGVRLYWRKDGEPIWNESRSDRDHRSGRAKAAIEDAERFAEGTAEQARRRFRTSSCRRIEDPSLLVAERKRACRSTSIPAIPNLSDPEERARHGARVRPGASTSRRASCCRCSAGTRRPRLVSHGLRWVSEKWSLRRGKLFLVPGDLPVRLPAALGLAAPWCLRPPIPISIPQDPLEERGALAGLCADAAGQRVEHFERCEAAEHTAGSCQEEWILSRARCAPLYRSSARRRHLRVHAARRKAGRLS